MYIVEMQVSKQSDYAEQCQYYAAHTLSQQLHRAESYDQLVPVIFVGIANFDIFPDTKDYLTHHKTVNTKTCTRTLDLLEYHFVEILKFNKKIHELTTVTDKWIFFLKEADSFETIPKEPKKPEAIEEAMEVLQESNWSKKERDTYFRHIDAWRVEKSVLLTAKKEGVKQGCYIVPVFLPIRNSKIPAATEAL